MLRGSTVGAFRSLVFKSLIAVFLIVRGDVAAKAQDLTGWWLSVDRTFPALIKAGIVVRMDELLIIGPQGAVENRMVLATYILDPQYCVESGRRCSDAPLLARAKLSIDPASRTLRFTERSAGRDSIDVPDVDQHIRNMSVINAEAWRLQIAENGNLILQATAPSWGIAQASDDGVRLGILDPAQKPVMRRFVRIEPTRLKRALTALSQTESSTDDWRCFLSNVTAGEPAFSEIHTPAAKKPAGIEAYLKVASYLGALQAASMTVTPDDPDPKEVEVAKKAREKTEVFIRERFEDIVEPTSAAERKRYYQKYFLITLRADALTDAKAAESLKTLSSGPPVALGVTEEEIAAYTALQADKSEKDRLFCRQ